MVNLPRDSVTLYGNASSDDKGIVSYQWKAKEGGASADTKVSNVLAFIIALFIYIFK